MAKSCKNGVMVGYSSAYRVIRPLKGKRLGSELAPYARPALLAKAGSRINSLEGLLKIMEQLFPIIGFTIIFFRL